MSCCRLSATTQMRKTHSTHSNEEVEKTGDRLSAQSRIFALLESRSHNLLPPSPISICMVGLLMNLLRSWIIISMKRGRRRRSVSRVLAYAYRADRIRTSSRAQNRRLCFIRARRFNSSKPSVSAAQYTTVSVSK